jgi:hypothetical protein
MSPWDVTGKHKAFQAYPLLQMGAAGIKIEIVI